MDCNAAQVANILAVVKGSSCISEKWTEPIGTYMETYVRGMEIVKFKVLTEKTVDAIYRAREGLLRIRSAESKESPLCIRSVESEERPLRIRSAESEEGNRE